MKTLEITSIQRGCVYDGHGVRTTVFLKGCPFSCPWCCNPETQKSGWDFFVDDSKCLRLAGVSSSLCDGCERNGGKRPLTSCPVGVCLPTTQAAMDAKKLAREVLRDKSLFISSGGGVTLSGGEPLLQANSLLPFLDIIRQEGVSCAMETTLYTKDMDRFKVLLPLISEWIVDLKLQKENYREDYLGIIKRNLELLRENKKSIRFRLVFIESLKMGNTLKALSFLEVNTLELIKCHGLSRSKYQKLGMDFKDYTPSEEAYQNFLEGLNENNIKTVRLSV